MGSDRPPFRVALVGAGGIARAHLPAWRELGVEVTVFSAAGAEELAASGGAAAAASLDEALVGADAVDVCTPTPIHGEVVLAALAAGHTRIVCEKPLGRTAAEARHTVEAAEAAGAQLYPGHVVRFFPEYAALHAAVAAGAVGTIAVQRFSRTGSSPASPWFHDDAQSGGILLDQMIHDLDQARWTAGEVATVFARDAATTGPGGSVVRSAHVLLTHVGGAISAVTGTWAPPGTPFRTTFEVAGTSGLLRQDSREHDEVVVTGGEHDAGGRGLLPALGATSPFLTELAEFLAAFTGGPPPRVTARDGLAAVVIAEAALESVRTGAPVALAQASEAAR